MRAKIHDMTKLGRRSGGLRRFGVRATKSDSVRLRGTLIPNKHTPVLLANRGCVFNLDLRS
jgi:hypothetical protein